MGFRFSEKFEQKKQEEFEKQYVNWGIVEQHVSEIKDGSLTTGMLQYARMNSYAQDKIYPKLTNEALIEKAEYYKNNCGRSQYPATTYNEALIHLIVPELIQRIKDLETKK